MVSDCEIFNKVRQNDEKHADFGRKFVEIDDEILLDIFSELWYNGNFGPCRWLAARAPPVSGIGKNKPKRALSARKNAEF